MRETAFIEEWILSEASDLNNTVHLASIGCDLALKEIYDKVVFPNSNDTAAT